MRPTALLVLLLALVPPARAAVWRRPVDGRVARTFAYGHDPFRRGWHRGVDLAAAQGTAVRAACTGTVVTARAVAGAGGVVTLLCGRWRVTHLPLAAIAVRPGLRVQAGARLGLLGGSRAHEGLHLGVRRAGDRFGYVNPLRFLGASRRRPLPPVLVVRRGAGLGPAPPVAAVPATATAARAGAAPGAQPWAAAEPVFGAALGARPRSAPGAAIGAPRARAARGGVRALAPWPAWAGLALVLSGGIAGGLRLRARVGWRRTAEEVPSPP